MTKTIKTTRLMGSLVLSLVLNGCGGSDANDVATGGAGKLSDKTPYSSFKSAEKKASPSQVAKSTANAADRASSRFGKSLAASAVGVKPALPEAAPVQPKRVLPPQAAMGARVGRPGMPFGPPGMPGRPFPRPPG